MNKEVEVTGLTLKTKVSSNLLISSTNAAGSYKADQLLEGRQALLEPVSSVNGKTGSFFYTVDAAEDGSKAHAASGTNVYGTYSEATPHTAVGEVTINSLAGKYKYDTTFNGAYGIDTKGGHGSGHEYDTAYGYVDYVFYLKATGNAEDQQIRMTACDLNYSYPEVGDPATATDPGDNAWRIAVFAHELTAAQGGIGNTGTEDAVAVGKIDPANVSGENAKVILMTEDSEGYFTPGKAVVAQDGLGWVNVAGAESPTAASFGEAVLEDDINAGETKYYKVLIRVWLEGEDKSCNTATYAQLENNWSLDVEFKLVEGDTTDASEAAVDTISKNGFTPDITPQQTAVTNPVEVVPNA